MAARDAYDNDDISTLLRMVLGGDGMDRLEGAGVYTPDTRYDVWHAVKAVGGDVTFGPGTVVASGDAPAEGDVLLDGDELVLPFTQVEVQEGTLYAFRG